MNKVHSAVEVKFSSAETPMLFILYSVGSNVTEGIGRPLYTY